MDYDKFPRLFIKFIFTLIIVLIMFYPNTAYQSAYQYRLTDRNVALTVLLEDIGLNMKKNKLIFNGNEYNSSYKEQMRIYSVRLADGTYIRIDCTQADVPVNCTMSFPKKDIVSSTLLASKFVVACIGKIPADMNSILFKITTAMRDCVDIGHYVSEIDSHFLFRSGQSPSDRYFIRFYRSEH